MVSENIGQCIKTREDKKLSPNRAKKAEQPMSEFEKKLTEHFGFLMKVAINKNDTGYIRIPFHDREHMSIILDKFGLKENVESIFGDKMK